MRPQHWANWHARQHAAPYPLPVVASSDVDDARLIHSDLAALDDDDLVHEAVRVTVALARTDRRAPDRAWLLERGRRVAAERRRRNLRQPRGGA
jgi:hypothetical protein